MEENSLRFTGKVKVRLRYTDRAKEDLGIAFGWYERQRRGLGFEFLDCVEAAI